MSFEVCRHYLLRDRCETCLREDLAAAEERAKVAEADRDDARAEADDLEATVSRLRVQLDLEKATRLDAERKGQGHLDEVIRLTSERDRLRVELAEVGVLFRALCAACDGP